uniref:Uncharacterized protein n=1 Tax=Anguilla anguilla TaxID=7936 RepID=A0A0E9Q425_ANGAN
MRVSQELCEKLQKRYF